ncbi:MAG: hypothetical protein A2Y07_03490 [Planctomycetes bacterium GWF2_50_10]|nr:MAG: hypothetical protein A2Y07_03490 [Planctomycetes bacterium GWF2_50_10]
MWILFATGLFLICAVLLVAEVFIPSFGMLGLMAFSCLVTGIYLFFQHSAAAGWVGVVIAMVMVPGVLITTYVLMPKTKMGKTLILQTPKSEPGGGVPDVDVISGLVGKEGEVVTMLRPVGTVAFGDLRVECMAESGYVDRGEKVKVLGIDGTQITVRKVD